MTTKRSSTRTIIISLIAAAFFGVFVLWGSVQVQISVLTWWDKVTASQEYKEQNRVKPIKNSPRWSSQPPSGNWENSPPLSEAMKMSIAEVEKNEALYQQITGIEIKTFQNSINERHEYSLDGENWTSNRESLIWKALEINPQTSSGRREGGVYFGTLSNTATIKSESSETPELDFKKLKEVEESIKLRPSLSVRQSESHVIYQNEKTWRTDSRQSPQYYALGEDHPPFKSYEELIVPDEISPQKPVTRSSSNFLSDDGVARYFSSSRGEFRREPISQGAPSQKVDLLNVFQLYEGGSIKMKRMKDLVEEKAGSYRIIYPESIYQGEEELDGEPVKVVVLNYYNIEGPKKLQSIRKLYLAHTKNYLPVRVEDFAPDGTEPMKVKTMSTLTEIKPGLWFPAEIVEQGISLTYGDYSMSFSVERMLSDSEITDRTLYKRITTHEVVQVDPDYDQSFFSTIPGVSESDLSFLKVAEQFVKHFQADEEEELLKLTHPDYFESKFLKTINDSPVKLHSLELYNYEMRKLPHDRSGQSYEIAAGVTFEAYNRKFTTQSVGKLSLLLRKDDQGNWRVDSCGPNYRSGYDELLNMRTEHLYKPPAVSLPSSPRKPAIAEKEKAEKSGTPSQ